MFLIQTSNSDKPNRECGPRPREPRRDDITLLYQTRCVDAIILSVHQWSNSEDFFIDEEDKISLLVEKLF